MFSYRGVPVVAFYLPVVLFVPRLQLALGRLKKWIHLKILDAYHILVQLIFLVVVWTYASSVLMQPKHLEWKPLDGLFDVSSKRNQRIWDSYQFFWHLRSYLTHADSRIINLNFVCASGFPAWPFLVALVRGRRKSTICFLCGLLFSLSRMVATPGGHFALYMFLGRTCAE